MDPPLIAELTAAALRCCSGATLPGEAVHQPRFVYDRGGVVAAARLPVCAPCAHTCFPSFERLRLVSFVGVDAEAASLPFACCCVTIRGADHSCFWAADRAVGRLREEERAFIRDEWAVERAAVLEAHGTARDPTASYLREHAAAKRRNEQRQRDLGMLARLPPPPPSLTAHRTFANTASSVVMRAGSSVNAEGSVYDEQPMIQRPPRRESSGLGLANCGNTCYAASILQLVIFRTPSVRSALLNQRRRDGTDSLLTKLMGGSVALSALSSALPPDWRLTQQQDPHEFWQWLVEHRAPAWAKATLTVRLRGMLRGVTCGHCWPRQSLSESMPILLQPPSNVDTSSGAAAVKVSALVGAFLQTLVEGGRCDNPSCRRETAVEQSLVLTGTPPLHLFVCVLRFARRSQRHSVLLDDGSCVETESSGYVKQSYPVVADRLVLPFLAADDGNSAVARTGAYTEAVYEASGFTEHHGASLSSGHYTAMIREPEDGEWYLYNDADVSRVDRTHARVADVIGDVAGGNGIARGRTEPYLLRYSIVQ